MLAIDWLLAVMLVIAVLGDVCEAVQNPLAFLRQVWYIPPARDRAIPNLLCRCLEESARDERAGTIPDPPWGTVPCIASWM